MLLIALGGLIPRSAAASILGDPSLQPSDQDQGWLVDHCRSKKNRGAPECAAIVQPTDPAAEPTASPAPAHDAQRGESRPASGPPAPLHWEGWKIMVSDVAALGLVAGGAGINGHGSSPFGSMLIGLGATVYGLGPGLIHGLDENESTGWKVGSTVGSIALRVGLPLGLCAIGSANAGGGEDAGLAGCIEGFTFGLGAAMLIDWFALSWVRRVEPEDRRTWDDRPMQVWVGPTTSGRSLGLAVGARW